ncbi:MAG TPA: hypothetical protein VFK20_06345, partial [Vicinamibacterales bacterium]|nr:hypothetical protein [Vicinamibacterales bacterium]
MKTISRYLASVTVASFAALAALAAQTVAPGPSAAVRFELSFPASTRAAATDGRVYVILSKDGSTEPRLQIQGYSGEAPFFGQNVDGMKPG